MNIKLLLSNNTIFTRKQVANCNQHLSIFLFLFAQKKKQKKGPTRTKSFESSIIRHLLDSTFKWFRAARGLSARSLFYLWIKKMLVNKGQGAWHKIVLRTFDVSKNFNFYFKIWFLSDSSNNKLWSCCLNLNIKT